MKYSLRKIKNFLTDESGPTAVEYAVMLALIAAVCIVSITAVGGESGNFWSANADRIDQIID